MNTREVFMARRSASRRGFTLVELMIVVAIIGVLAALAIYGVRRYLTAAKTAEAKNAVGAIARAGALAYERERANAQLLAEGEPADAAVHVLCKSAIPVPAAAVPKGVKYQPSTGFGTDFETGGTLHGWLCLNFSVAQPMYYRLTYMQGSGYLSTGVGGPDPGAEGFEAAAQGDLNGDSAVSTFARSGKISNNHVVLATTVFVHNELE